MKKNKKIYIKLLIFIISLYAIFTLISQQNTLNQYSKNSQEISQKIEEEKQEKEDVNSLEFIEQTAREKLDMFYPNEKVYIDKGM